MRNIAVTTDFSDLARHAYASAADLARKEGATIHLLHAEEPVPPLLFRMVRSEFRMDGYYVKLRAELDAEAKHSAFSGLSVDPHILSTGHPIDTIEQFVEEHEIDLIVQATHGRSALAHALIGSFAEMVARRSSVPVLTCRPREGAAEGFAPTNLLVPFDFSDCSAAVLPTLRRLADTYGAHATLLHVVPEVYPGPYVHDYVTQVYGEALAEAKERFDVLRREKLSDLEVEFEVRQGRPQRVICDRAAELEADLVLLATHGRSGFDRVVMGSIAERVIRGAPCSVWSVRPPETCGGGEATAAMSGQARSGSENG